ncbi:hypothetical protein IGI37_001402 [Enterococcus sp. AZ194]|uniref:ABC transporter permease subunit n=1 Tax=Enterococcus sp. AZ194 TaxID=2774629 RepID=UPI003F2869FE
MNVLTIAWLSFKERTQRFSFVMFLAVIVLATFFILPTTTLHGIRVVTIDPDVYQQAGNATWVPTVTALILGLLLPLASFGYVQGMIGLDRETGTMAMLLANGLGRFSYVFGKWLASILLLSINLLVLMATSFLAMSLHYPGESISLWAFLSPFLAIFPAQLFVAALSLVFETVKFFRTNRSNTLVTISFFVLWLANLISSSSAMQARGNSFVPDFAGTNLIFKGADAAALTATGKELGGMTFFSSGQYALGHGTAELIFNGLVPNFSTFTTLILVVILSIALVILASLFLERKPLVIEQKAQADSKRRQKNLPVTGLSWAPVSSQKFHYLGMIKVEFLRLLKETSWIFGVTGLALWVICWFIDFELMIRFIPPVLLIWGMFPLSNLGSYEKQTQVLDLLRTIPKAPIRQAISSLSTIGFLFVLMLMPICCRIIIHVGIVPAFMVVALFFCVISLAFFLGSLTQQARFFEIILLVYAYVLLNAPGGFLPMVSQKALFMGVGYFSVGLVALILILLERKRLS